MHVSFLYHVQSITAMLPCVDVRIYRSCGLLRPSPDVKRGWYFRD